MSSEPFLILGFAPPNAKPENFYFAGPWSFVGQERNFPDWENKFKFAPEPLANANLLNAAAKCAQILSLKYLMPIASQLDKNYDKFPQIYWQILLLPWLINVAGQIVERSLRVEWLLNKWQNLPFNVYLYPRQNYSKNNKAKIYDVNFNFINEKDYALRGGLGCDYNWWLLSVFIRDQFPGNWHCAENEANYQPSLLKPFQTNISGSQKIKKIIQRGLLTLCFPRLKGMSFFQSLIYSRALHHPCHTPDRSVDLNEYLDDFKFEKLNEQVKNKSESEIFKKILNKDHLLIFQKSLPQSIKDLQHNSENCTATKKHYLRIASIVSYEDAKYRQKLAYWRAQGNRIGYMQHGGNYGQVKVACDIEMIEYSQDVFFTWGWKKHNDFPGNFIPMPSPQLSWEADSWQMQKKKIIFVGTEMAAYGYRLDSRPTPLQFLNYRKAKETFFKNLPQGLIKFCSYRPYFDLPGTFEDAQWLLPKFPQLSLCKGPLFPQLQKCSLVVLDHHGTTMLEVLAANIPVIMYWDITQWPLTQENEALINILQSVGVWYPDPVAAAKKVADIWEDSKKWYQQKIIQEARKKVCRQIALYSEDNLNNNWIEKLKNI